jgi:uncharacterized protein YegL
MSQSQIDVDSLLDEMETRVARVPNLFLLDTSSSMRGERINKVNNGLEQFVNEVGQDDEAEWAIDVSIVSFGGSVSVEQDFRPISEAWIDDNGDANPPQMNASGGTPMCEGIVEGLEHLEEYKSVLDDEGVSRKRALVWLLTDGEPNQGPGTDDWNAAQDLIKNGTEETEEKNPHMFFFAAGVGSDAGTDRLAELVSAGNGDVVEAFDLKEHMFEEVFEVASKSAKGSASGDGGETTEDVLPDDISESDDSGQI